MRPIQARINTAALRNNLEMARRHAGSAGLMAVIKADAYGHGLLRAAEALRTADAFAVVELDSAIALREAGYRQRIVLLEGFFCVDELPLFAEYRLIPVCHSVEQIEMLAASGLPVQLEVFLKLNTGMNRLGFRPEHFQVALQALQSIPAVGEITLMTHFACADEADGIADQLARFEQLTEGLHLAKSLANSAALLAYPELAADWARPGIMLYGASPFAQRGADEFGLQPVMTLTSEIIAVQVVQPGEAVGYGATFRTQQEKRIGIVACGYADGYPRHAPTGTPVLVDGRLAHSVGRVSMDMLAVDLTGIASAGVGSKVTLWGEGLPVEEVARAAGTISYELLCAVAPRVRVVEVEEQR